MTSRIIPRALQIGSRLRKSLPSVALAATALVGSTTVPVGNVLAANVNYGVPTPPGPFVSPKPGPILPPPVKVPGKEFTTHLNTDFAGANIPGQSLIWDGLGGTANIHNYGVEVDALANVKDALFKEVIDNRTFCCSPCKETSTSSLSLR